MVEVIGIKNCNTVKKTLDWLNENGTEWQLRDVKKDPLTPQELADLVGKLGIETLANTKGRKWKNLGLADKELSDNDMFEVLLENQTAIKRPVLISGQSIMVGFDESSLEEFLAAEE